jgi:hypothetical protein
VRSEMVRAWVESLLEELTGQEKITPDGDGDYPVRYRDSLYYVRLIGETHPVVQVFSVVVTEIHATPGLYESLNNLNRDIRFARAFWVRDQVLIERDLVGEELTRSDFHEACTAVATIADAVGDDLAKQHGGQAVTPTGHPNDVSSQDHRTFTGLYL